MSGATPSRFVLLNDVPTDLLYFWAYLTPPSLVAGRMIFVWAASPKMPHPSPGPNVAIVCSTAVKWCVDEFGAITVIIWPVRV